MTYTIKKLEWHKVHDDTWQTFGPNCKYRIELVAGKYVLWYSTDRHFGRVGESSTLRGAKLRASRLHRRDMERFLTPAEGQA